MSGCQPVSAEIVTFIVVSFSCRVGKCRGQKLVSALQRVLTREISLSREKATKSTGMCQERQIFREPADCQEGGRVIQRPALPFEHGAGVGRLAEVEHRTTNEAREIAASDFSGENAASDLGSLDR